MEVIGYVSFSIENSGNLVFSLEEYIASCGFIDSYEIIEFKQLNINIESDDYEKIIDEISTNFECETSLNIKIAKPDTPSEICSYLFNEGKYIYLANMPKSMKDDIDYDFIEISGLYIEDKVIDTESIILNYIQQCDELKVVSSITMA
jgi:hypothetical protein